MISTIPRVFRNVARLLKNNDVGASIKVEIIRDMSAIEKGRLDDRRSAGFDCSQAYDLMCELCSN